MANREIKKIVLGASVDIADLVSKRIDKQLSGKNVQATGAALEAIRERYETSITYYLLSEVSDAGGLPALENLARCTQESQSERVASTVLAGILSYIYLENDGRKPFDVTERLRLSREIISSGKCNQKDLRHAAGAAIHMGLNPELFFELCHAGIAELGQQFTHQDIYGFRGNLAQVLDEVMRVMISREDVGWVKYANQKLLKCEADMRVYAALVEREQQGRELPMGKPAERERF